MANKVLLIYFAEHSKDILEKYSEYFFEHIENYASDIYIVGKQNISSKYHMLVLVDEISNPLQAYLKAMELIGFENIKAYDRLICVSDDIMGPLYDFSTLFSEMSERNCDVWSITRQHKTPMNYLDYTGENLQEEYLHTEFIVFESSVISSDRFFDILSKAVEKENERDSWIDNRALSLSRKLSENGFSMSSYVDDSDLSKTYYNTLLLCPELIISKKKCPVFSRKSFTGDYSFLISNTVGNASIELMDYLKEKTDYDTDMIWESVLKDGNQQDIYNNLHLNYILDSKISDEEKTKEILKKKKVALVMHLYFMDLLTESFHYASSFPEEGDIYITTNTEEKKKEIEEAFKELKCKKLDIRVVENRGRDVSALLTGVKDVIMDYDYVCFVHDKKSAQLVPASIGRDFGYQCFENTLGSSAFVNNVICTLYDNDRLGLLSPIYPIHGSYYAIHGNIDWAGNFENTKKLAEKLGVTVPIEKDKSPVAPLGTMFWFKTPALKILYDCDWEYSDFPEEPNGVDGTLLHAVERMYSYSAQQAGYYPAILCNETFADISLTNSAVFFQGINRSLEKYAAYFSYQQSVNVIESMLYEVELLRQRTNMFGEENEKLRLMVAELIPKTSLKWQLKDRFKRIFTRDK